MTRATKPATLFICIVDYNGPTAVVGYLGEPHRLFDDACDDYVEARDNDRPAFVLRLNLNEGTHEDITGDCHDSIAHWIHQRGKTAPDWLQNDTDSFSGSNCWGPHCRWGNFLI